MTPDVTCEVPVPPGHDLVGSLRLSRFGRRDPCWHLAEDEAAHATWTPEGPATARLRAHPDHVAAALWGPGAGWLSARVPAWIGLDDTPERFVPDHPEIAARHAVHGAHHLPKHPVLVEALVAVVLQQRVTYAEAAGAWRRMAQDWGVPAPGPLGLQTPPDPTVAARQPYEAFHGYGVERRRALLIRELWRRRHRIQALTEVPVAEARRVLRTIPGIGPWTEAMIAGCALGDADALPLGDVHLPHTIAWVLHRQERSDDDQMVAQMARFQPHRWRVVRLMVETGAKAPARGPKRRTGWVRGA